VSQLDHAFRFDGIGQFLRFHDCLIVVLSGAEWAEAIVVMPDQLVGQKAYLMHPTRTVCRLGYDFPANTLDVSTLFVSTDDYAELSNECGYYCDNFHDFPALFE